MENTKLRMRNSFSSSSSSGEVATRNRKGTFIVACALLAICGLVASAPAASAANQLTLGWQNNDSTVDGFKIERSSNALNFTQIAQVPSTQMSYVDTGLTSGATYSYRLRAYNSAGDSDYSNVASGTIPSSAPGTAPGNLQATTVSIGQVNMSWGSVAGATGYTIERASYNAGPWSQIANVVGSGVTTYQDKGGVWDNQTYFYRIRAYNGTGSSGYSAVISATTPADPYLLGHWNLDESSGTIASDLSVNHNLGAVSNVTRTTGISGRALDFNGVDAQVLLPDTAALNPTNAITVALWIAPNSWAGVPRLLQKGPGPDQYRLFARDGNLRFSLAGVNLDTPAPEPGFWYHVAGTFDGSVMKLFIDGQLVAQRTASVSMDTDTGPLCIGGKSLAGGAFQFFDGAIDDVRIYGRALTAGEIQNLASP